MWISGGRSRYAGRASDVPALAWRRGTRPAGSACAGTGETAPSPRCCASRNSMLHGRRWKAMTPTASQGLADLRVTTLAQEARRNIARYLVDRRPNEDPYAFELFQRAIVQDDQDAWAALYDLYHALVRNWIANRLAGDIHADICEALVNDAFVKFFRAIDATRFCQFASAPVLLAYLKTCA